MHKLHFDIHFKHEAEAHTKFSPSQLSTPTNADSKLSSDSTGSVVHTRWCGYAPPVDRYGQRPGRGHYPLPSSQNQCPTVRGSYFSLLLPDDQFQNIQHEESSKWICVFRSCSVMFAMTNTRGGLDNIRWVTLRTTSKQQTEYRFIKFWTTRHHGVR